MKKWNTPEVNELNINETAHDWFGRYKDGGYIGDGEISGHQTNTKPTPSATPVPEEPENKLS